MIVSAVGEMHVVKHNTVYNVSNAATLGRAGNFIIQDACAKYLTARIYLLLED